MRNYNRFKNRYRSALYIISIIFLIFSCKDDSLFVNNSTDIIAFNVSVERLNNTKGLPINSSADTSFTNFGLFIYQTPLNASFSDDTLVVFDDGEFNNKIVNKSSDNDWSLNTIYYWPQNKNLSFFAYAPYADSLTNGLILDTNNDNIPGLIYNVPNNVVNQPDLMIAISQKNIYKEVVNLSFSHALAAIGVNVTAPQLQIDSIWVIGVITSGKLSIDYDGVSPVWNDLGSVNDTSIFKIGIVNDAVATEKGDTIMTNDGFLMMIPQTLSENAYMRIYFKGMEMKEISLKTSSVTEWKNGVKYMYSIYEGDYDFEVTLDIDTCDYTGGDFNFNITSTYTPVNGEPSDMPWTVAVISDTINGIVSDTTWLNSISSLSGNGGTKVAKILSAGVAPYDASKASILDSALLTTAEVTTTQDLSYYTNSSITSTFNNTYSSANCYIVNAAGSYKFPCWVMGNGMLKVEDGATTTEPNNTNCISQKAPYFVDYAGNDIKDASDLIIPTAGATAELLWQDAPGLITDVAISDDNRYITFNVPKSSLRTGNAVIAIKNSSSVIMWSWHIWVTPWSLNLIEVSEGEIDFFANNIGTCYQSTYVYQERVAKIQFIQQESNQVYEFLITQVKDSIVQLFNSPYYQWGRKDPMLSSNGQGANKQCYGNTPFTVSSTSGPTTISNAINNPNIFYTSSGSWFTDSMGLWSVIIDTVQHKSVYDPSPNGFRVPQREVFGKLKRDIGWTVEDNFGLYYFQYPTSKDGQTMILILLADGERVGTTGNIASDNAKGFYWSSTPFSNNNAYGLNFYEDLDYQFIHNYSNSNAYTVAPVREYITD